MTAYFSEEPACRAEFMVGIRGMLNEIASLALLDGNDSSRKVTPSQEGWVNNMINDSR